MLSTDARPGASDAHDGRDGLRIGLGLELEWRRGRIVERDVIGWERWRSGRSRGRVRGKRRRDGRIGRCRIGEWRRVGRGGRFGGWRSWRRSGFG